jgi:glycosyltransferase involved in cell wall biosynthesis
MLEIGVDIKSIRFITIPLIGPLFLIGGALILAMSQIIRSKPDAIYTLGGSMGTGILLARIFGCPLITEVNGWGRAELKLSTRRGFSRLLSTIARWIDEKEMVHSDYLVVVSNSLRNILHESLNIDPSKISVIPNGANLDLFKPINGVKKDLELDLNCYYAGSIGIIAPWQGLEHLIRSAPLVLKEIPNTKFLVVGDGESKNKLVELVKELDLAAHFVFVGAVPYTEVPKYINGMDVCVSFRKGTPASPLKLYEYMLCGKAVVATDDSDNGFVKEQNAGILIDPERLDEAAEAIVRLLRDDKLREQMGENGRKYVLEKRSWQAVAQEVEGVIKAVISKKT